MKELSEILSFQSRAETRLGPFRILDPNQQEEYSRFSQIIRQCISEVKSSKSNNRLHFEAPSAFHAAVFLKELQNGFIYSPGHSSPNVPGPLLFRGIKDINYDIVSSLHRYEGDKKEGSNKSIRFAELMKEMGDRSVETELPVESYLSVSQHYGFPTNLIDFTPDPEVAVFFAMKEGSDKTSVVYFKLISDFLNGNLAVLLPPPLFHRIYIQRGVFVKSEGKLTKEEFHQITFPSGADFIIHRNGKALGENEILLNTEWIENAVSHIKQYNQTDNFWINQVRSMPKILKEFELLKWLDFYEDSIYWLATVMNDLGEYRLSDIHSFIQKSNDELFILHEKICEKLSQVR